MCGFEATRICKPYLSSFWPYTWIQQSSPVSLSSFPAWQPETSLRSLKEEDEVSCDPLLPWGPLEHLYFSLCL